jgi:hypothetical protein
MLSTILQQNDGTTTTRINPKGVGICRRPFKSCNPLKNPAILVNGIQARTCKNTNFSMQKSKEHSKKPKGAKRKLTLQLLARRFNDSNKKRIAFFEMDNLGH